MYVSAQSALAAKKSKVRNPETPTRLNALVFSFRRRTPPLRTPALLLPAAAGGRLRGRGAHRPDTRRRQQRSGPCRYRSKFERIFKRASGTKFSAAVTAVSLLVCAVGIRVTRHGTAAFRPAKENSPRPPHALFATLRTTSEGGGVGRATEPTGNDPSSDTILPGLTFAFSSVCGMWHEARHEMIRTEGGTGEPSDKRGLWYYL